MSRAEKKSAYSRTVTVLSPHFDDAVFSLCLHLLEWQQADVTVLNFFTVSGFAPRCTSQDPAVVSAIREREDRRALGLVSPRIRIKSLGLLDAPLRLGVPVASVFTAETQELHPLRLRGLVVAPLGLGNHVDHLTVRAAAIATRNSRVCFYEDLPYAAWTSESALRGRIREVEQVMHVRLHPVILRRPHAVAVKRRMVKVYRSQISPEEADLIARFAAKYGGGERVWMPRAVLRQMATLYRPRWRPG